jgi:orotate phosphoribosyltransferase
MSDDLAQRINRVSRLEGSFVLRSGQHATHYFDKYRFEADPVLLRELARRMLDLLPDGTEVLAGLELGGVPLATAMSLEAGLPLVFVRKEAKTYGTCRAVEGAEVRGRQTVIIEDVITTGGAVADAAILLRAEGAELTRVICAIWRGKGAPGIARLPEVPIMPALTEADLAGG